MLFVILIHWVAACASPRQLACLPVNLSLPTHFAPHPDIASVLEATSEVPGAFLFYGHRARD